MTGMLQDGIHSDMPRPMASLPDAGELIENNDIKKKCLDNLGFPRFGFGVCPQAPRGLKLIAEASSMCQGGVQRAPKWALIARRACQTRLALRT